MGAGWERNRRGASVFGQIVGGWKEKLHFYWGGFEVRKCDLHDFTDLKYWKYIQIYYKENFKSHWNNKNIQFSKIYTKNYTDLNTLTLTPSFFSCDNKHFL